MCVCDGHGWDSGGLTGVWFSREGPAEESTQRAAPARGATWDLIGTMSQKREMKGCQPHMVSLSSLSCLPELRVPVCSEDPFVPTLAGAASPSGQFLLGMEGRILFPLSPSQTI